MTDKDLYDGTGRLVDTRRSCQLSWSKKSVVPVRYSYSHLEV